MGNQSVAALWVLNSKGVKGFEHQGPARRASIFINSSISGFLSHHSRQFESNGIIRLHGNDNGVMGLDSRLHGNDNGVKGMTRGLPSPGLLKIVLTPDPEAKV